MIYSIILYLLILIVFIWRISNGFKKGFAFELTSMISTIIAVIVGRLLVKSYFALVSSKYGVLISTIALISLVFFIYKIILFIMKIMKLFANLPVIRGVDRLLGLFAGAVEAVAILIILIQVLKMVIGL